MRDVEVTFGWESDRIQIAELGIDLSINKRVYVKENHFLDCDGAGVEWLYC